MILGRKYNKKNDMNEVKELLVNNNIYQNLNENEIVYVLKENDSIIGVSQISRFNNTAILDFIVVDTNSRGNDYGDGLLRAIMNYCLSRGYNEVYYKKVNAYLDYIGFDKIKLEELSIELKNISTDDTIMVCNLENFFSKCCRSRR